jgi:hypothetical protein
MLQKYKAQAEHPFSELHGTRSVLDFGFACSPKVV